MGKKKSEEVVAMEELHVEAVAAKTEVPAAIPANGGTIARASTNHTHSVARQVELLRSSLQSEKRRVGLFLGAGCPLGIYDRDGIKSVGHIPDVAGLTVKVASGLNGADKSHWEKLHTACQSPNCTVNVEHVLTQLRTICSLKGVSALDGMTSDDLKTLDTTICQQIALHVGKPLPQYICSYHRLAAWVGQIDRPHAIEVFTPNYDLLLEESFEHYRVPFFDGFVGSREPFFDLAAMEHDGVPARWARLWKLHGSINWVRREDESIYRSANSANARLMIYPSHLKYDQSRRMPYLAMLDRLRAFLRDVSAVLIVCGYSFADQHLNEVIADGLRSNRAAHCFALMYKKLDEHPEAQSQASRLANLTLLAHDGAVIGTRTGKYQMLDVSKASHACGFKTVTPKDGAEAEPQNVHCTLGDFHEFTLFLETQFGIDVDDAR